eukprot:m.135718 g.135718  ORF g.135718 m.135718 type:complete len:151 (-) comp11422_c0_seq3:228-680(-)
MPPAAPVSVSSQWPLGVAFDALGLALEEEDEQQLPAAEVVARSALGGRPGRMRVSGSRRKDSTTSLTAGKGKFAPVRGAAVSPPSKKLTGSSAYIRASTSSHVRAVAMTWPPPPRAPSSGVFIIVYHFATESPRMFVVQTEQCTYVTSQT